MESKDQLRALEASVNVLAKVVDRLDKIQNPTPGPFRTGGEFLTAMRNRDPRLKNAQSAYSTELDGPSGGYALPPAQAAILTPVLGEGSLFGRFNPFVTQSSILRVAVDESADWTDPAVIVDAGDAVAGGMPGEMQLRNVSLYTLRPLVHVDEKLDRDLSGAYATYLWGVLGRKIQGGVESYLLRGTGENQPVGLINAPGKIVAPAATSTSDALGVGDLGSMISRLVSGGFTRSFWIIHSTVIPQLAALPSGIFTQGAEGLMLFSRPVIVSEWAEPVGTQGDIILVDPSGCMAAVQGPRQDATIYFAFDQGLQSFRASLDFGFAPLIETPIARRTGGDTVGHVVLLATREE